MNELQDAIYDSLQGHKEDMVELLHLELPVRLQVWFGEESGGYLALHPLTTQGLYIAPTVDTPIHTVCVRMDSDIVQVIDSLAHEMRHAWQYENACNEELVRNKLHAFMVRVVAKVVKDIATLQYANAWEEVDARVFASWYVGGEDTPCPTVPMLEDMRVRYPSLSDGELRMMRRRAGNDYAQHGPNSIIS